MIDEGHTTNNHKSEDGIHIFLEEIWSGYLLGRWIRRRHDDLVRDATCEQKNELQSC